MVFSPAQASQGLERRTDFNSGVLETSEKRECVCVGRGRGVEGRVIGKSVSLPSSPLSLMINSNIFKKGVRATGGGEEMIMMTMIIDMAIMTMMTIIITIVFVMKTMMKMITMIMIM